VCLALYYLNQAGILLVVFNQHICGPLEIVKEDITVCAWQIMNNVICIIFECIDVEHLLEHAEEDVGQAG
jgi:hypothetical protein